MSEKAENYALGIILFYIGGLVTLFIGMGVAVAKYFVEAATQVCSPLTCHPELTIVAVIFFLIVLLMGIFGFDAASVQNYYFIFSYIGAGIAIAMLYAQYAWTGWCLFCIVMEGCLLLTGLMNIIVTYCYQKGRLYE